MTAPDKIWIACPASECGHYYPNATEAEGKSVAYSETRSEPASRQGDFLPAFHPRAEPGALAFGILAAWISAMEDWDEGHAAQKIDEIRTIIGDVE